jgi:hypothetical protein
VRLTNCETRKLDNISHISLLERLVRLTRLVLIFSREASLIFYKILARKIAKRDSLSTLEESYCKISKEMSLYFGLHVFCSSKVESQNFSQCSVYSVHCTVHS